MCICGMKEEKRLTELMRLKSLNSLSLSGMKIQKKRKNWGWNSGSVIGYYIQCGVCPVFNVQHRPRRRKTKRWGRL